MNITNQLSIMVRSLDPAHTPEHVDPRIDPRAQALLLRTLKAPQHGDTAVSVRAVGLSRRVVPVAIAAAAAAAALVVVPSYLGGSEASAWSAMPQLNAANAVTAQEACSTQLGSHWFPRKISASLSGLVPVVTDVRGPLVLVYMTNGRSNLTCYFENGKAEFAGDAADAGAQQAPEVPADSVQGSSGSAVKTSQGTIRAATGRVGADVVSVVLDTVAEGAVTATVTDQHFAAWWPDDAVTDDSEDDRTASDQFSGVSVTLRDGTVRKIAVAQFLES